MYGMSKDQCHFTFIMKIMIEIIPSRYVEKILQHSRQGMEIFIHFLFFYFDGFPKWPWWVRMRTIPRVVTLYSPIFPDDDPLRVAEDRPTYLQVRLRHVGHVGHVGHASEVLNQRHQPRKQVYRAWKTFISLNLKADTFVGLDF